MTGAHVTDLLSAYADGRLGAPERERVEAHLAACEDCRSAWLRLRETIALVASLPGEEPPPELRPRVLERVRRLAAGEPAEEVGGSTRRVREGGRREVRGVERKTERRWRVPVWIAAAAVVLFAVGLAVQSLGGMGGGAVRSVATDQAADRDVAEQSEALGEPATAGNEEATGGGMAAGGDESARSSAPEADVAQSTGEEGSAEPGGEIQRFAAGRKVILSGRATLESEDVPGAFRELQRRVRTRGGFVAASELRRLSRDVDDDSEPRWRAHLRVRVPVGEFDGFVDGLAELGTIEGYRTGTEDVTRQYVDAEARLRNLEAEEARLLEIIRQAASVQELLQVENRLWRVRGQIEQLQGQLRFWDDQIALSTLEIEIREPAQQGRPPSAGDGIAARLGEAFRRALDYVVAGIETIIIGAGAVLPWAVLAGLAWWGYRRWDAGQVKRSEGA